MTDIKLLEMYLPSVLGGYYRIGNSSVRLVIDAVVQIFHQYLTGFC